MGALRDIGPVETSVMAAATRFVAIGRAVGVVACTVLLPMGASSMVPLAVACVVCTWQWAFTRMVLKGPAGLAAVLDSGVVAAACLALPWLGLAHGYLNFDDWGQRATSMVVAAGQWWTRPRAGALLAIAVAGRRRWSGTGRGRLEHGHPARGDVVVAGRAVAVPRGAGRTWCPSGRRGLRGGGGRAPCGATRGGAAGRRPGAPGVAARHRRDDADDGSLARGRGPRTARSGAGRTGATRRGDPSGGRPRHTPGDRDAAGHDRRARTGT